MAKSALVFVCAIFCAQIACNKHTGGSGKIPTSQNNNPTATSTSTSTDAGPWNPSFEISASLQTNEILSVVPTYAYLDASGLHGKFDLNVYKPLSGFFGTAALKALANVLNIPDDQVSTNFNRRAGAFAVNYIPKRDFQLSMNGGLIGQQTTGTDGDIHFTFDDVKAAAAKAEIDGEGSFVVKPTFRLNSGSADLLSGFGVEVLRPKGLSVITDIDDTLKVTNVTDQNAMLRATFVDNFVPIAGMADYLRYMKTDCKASIHYVSGSPEQLGEELWRFFNDQQFPLGSMHLKRLRIKDGSYMQLLPTNQQSYKKEILQRIFRDLAQRSFVLIGDTSEKDPETYQEMLASDGARIKKIILRAPAITPTIQARIDSLFPDKSKIILVSDGTTLSKTCNF